MYLLGHIAMGYLFAWFVARTMRQKLVLWAALTAGIVPDLDLLFGGVGLDHATYLHSLVVWVPLALLFGYWKKESLPYIAAILQHIVIGDLLIGLPLLLPLSDVHLGLGLEMSSMPDALIEFSSLLVMAFVMLRSGDLGRLMAGGREGLLVAVPLVSMIGLTWYAENGPALSVIQGTQRLVDYGSSTEALTIITIGHILLAGLMAAAVLKAILTIRPTRKLTTLVA